MFCKNCGEKINHPNTDYCSNCGIKNPSSEEGSENDWLGIEKMVKKNKTGSRWYIWVTIAIIIIGALGVYEWRKMETAKLEQEKDKQAQEQQLQEDQLRSQTQQQEY